MIDVSYTSLVFAAGLLAGAALDLLLLRTYLVPPFRIWPAPEPGSWQSLTFWGLFRGAWLRPLSSPYWIGIARACSMRGVILAACRCSLLASASLSSAISILASATLIVVPM